MMAERPGPGVQRPELQWEDHPPVCRGRMAEGSDQDCDLAKCRRDLIAR